MPVPDEVEPDRSSGRTWQSEERERLQTTASTLGMWQGRTDARLDSVIIRVDAQNGTLDKISSSITQITVDLAVVRSRVALFSAIGGLLGSGIVTVVIQLGVH